MKISRRMQRQVEIVIRHAQARDAQHAEVPPAVPGPYPQTGKMREENGAR